jgi:hypothetical protein
MQYGKYLFQCRFDSETILPFYKGSTFRGVFGQALKKVVCALKLQECTQCLLKHQCLYVQVFEASQYRQPSIGARIASPPQPFVIEPPLTNETHFEVGSPFNFSLLLFGDVNNRLPYFIYAFDQMGKIGIGKRVNGFRGMFSLRAVVADGKTIYSDKNETLKTVDSQKELFLSDLNAQSDDRNRLKLILETPLRLKFQNRLKADLPFHVLVRAMLRRVSSLFNCYGDGEPDLDYSGLVNRAKRVRIIESNLSWYDWRRFSHRQDSAMLMGGMVGSVAYEGYIEEYVPLIEICQKIHLGKQTSFGLGKIRIET